MMDMDEVYEEFCRYIVENGSEEAAEIAMDADAAFSDIDSDELADLLIDFGDDYGVHAYKVALMMFSGSL